MSKKTKPSELSVDEVIARNQSAYRFVPLGITILLLALYWRATGYGFVFAGEFGQLLSNPDIMGSTGLPAAFAANLPWQPLAWLSHMLDFSLFGTKPGPQRVVSLLLHAGNAALIIAVFRRWLGPSGGALLACLFAIHPLRVEPVIWLVERRMLLATLFTLLAVRAHVQRVEHGGVAGRLGIFVFGLLAALSHPVGAALPLLLLMLDAWPMGRSMEWSARLSEKLELGAVSLFTIAMCARGAVNPEALWTNGTLDWGTRAMHALSGLGMALIRTLVPFPLTVWNSLEPPVWAGVAAVVACGAGLVLGSTALRMGIGWFLAAMLPALGLLHPEVAPWSDSGTYLAHIGLLAALVWIGMRWDEDKLMAIAFAAVMIWLGLSWLRVGEWQSSEPLLRLAEARGGHPLAHYQLGQLMVEGRRPLEAEKELRQVLAARPQHVETRLLLANAFLLQQRNPEAAEIYREAIRLAPGRADSYYALGLLETSTGQPLEGIAHLTQGIKMGLTKEQEAQAENAIGVYQLNQKQYAEAAEHLKRSWMLVPSYASAHRNYALTLDGMGQPGRAFKHLEKARLYTKDAPEVVEVWAMVFNKLAAEEKRRMEQEKAARMNKK